MIERVFRADGQSGGHRLPTHDRQRIIHETLLGKIFLSGLGGLTASFASMLCCTGPLVMASMGLSGVGLAAFRPYRPIFLGITVVFLWVAYRQMDREDSCNSDKPCADPRYRRRMKWALWTMTAGAFVFATSPRWAGWVFG